MYRCCVGVLLTAGLVLSLSVGAPAQVREALLQMADSGGKSKKFVTNPIPGISGMAEAPDGAYLVVHDAKAHKKKQPRVGLLEADADKERLRYRKLDLVDEKKREVFSNDLESVCRLPGQPDEFLLAESGYWKKKFGRIFHVRLHDKKLRVKRTLPLPLLADNNETQRDGDNFEGIACGAAADGKVAIILGERGGTKRYPTGILRWGFYDPESGDFQPAKEKSISVTAPSVWNSPSKRHITDLYLDKTGIFWGSAAVDDDVDFGPFRSFVYQIGCFTGSRDAPLTLLENTPVWIADGYKIEALSAGDIEKYRLSIGTEDEDLGGSWRRLPNTPTMGSALPQPCS